MKNKYTFLKPYVIVLRYKVCKAILPQNITKIKYVMKKFFEKFQNLKGSKFVGIKNYHNKYGEIADLVVNANVDIHNAKVKDLETLKSISDKDLKDISVNYNLPFKTLQVALNELIASGEKNLSPNMDERTNQSKAQADAYIHLTPAIKLHKDTLNVFVSGFLNNKKVLVKGEYPKRNKRVKTLCKEAITKHLDLRMNNYRQYNIGNMNEINITGDTLQMK